MFRRYGIGARFYDVLSGERFIYRAGRVAAIDALGLRPGDTVLDLGCGTGLNFPLLIERVGPSGLVIGLDASSSMLRMARSRVSSHRWANVRLIEGDATKIDPSLVMSAIDASTLDSDRVTPGGPLPRVDAVLSTYALSVTGDWRSAWRLARGVLAPRGRAGIVDMSTPTGPAAILAPLARLACTLGGADMRAHPWRALEADGTDVEHTVLRGGHVHVVTGTMR